ncbi:MAG TPA: SDR family NAD(P)-dependent oxidoreductase [Mycobacteriales bacterium]|nr:SDR family NAD(P)-dependent oxidoreductase [Mycobacteriales bacterium]
MKVLVTGGTGFVGAHTVAALLDAGHEVRVLARRPERVASTIGALGVDVATVDVAEGDMTDADAVARAVKGVDAVIHSAAVVAALDRRQAERSVDTNVDGTRIVIDAAVAEGCDPIVHVSSIAAVFTPSVEVVTADLPLMTAADNPYTRSKALADQVARDRQSAGRPVTIVYPGGVIGPPVGNVCGDAAEGFASILRIGFLVLSEGGINVIDVRDLAAVLVATLTPGRGPRRYMAGGTLVPMSEIIATFRRATGKRIPAVRAPGSVYRGLGATLDAMRRVVAFNSPFTAEGMQLLTLAKDTDDSAVHDDLGISYRPATDTLTDALRGLYAAGRVTARQAGNLAR